MRYLFRNRKGYAEVIGGIVALMVTIIVAILIYWSISPNLVPTTVTERFTGYTLPTGGASTGGSNGTWQHITLTYAPNSETNATMTLICWNATGNTKTSPPKVIYTGNRTVWIQPNDNNAGTATTGNPAGYTQINVSYTTLVSDKIANVDTTSSTVFNLLPIIAIVSVGAILIGLVMSFGRKPNGGV